MSKLFQPTWIFHLPATYISPVHFFKLIHFIFADKTKGKGTISGLLGFAFSDVFYGLCETITGLRRSCNLLENRAHMVASVPVLTCHVTAVMGLSMAAQTTGSQEPVSCGSWGRAGRGWEDDKVSWSAWGQRSWSAGGVKESAFRCTLWQPSFMCDLEEIELRDEFRFFFWR